MGWPVERPEAAVRAGRALLDRAPRVVVTLGSDGAVAVDREGAWWARPALPASLAAEVAEGSAVGAGDAFLAALLLALDAGRALADALPGAVATGTAALLSRGPALVARDDVARVRPHVRLDPLPPDA